MTETLRPCPFCGGRAVYVGGGGRCADPECPGWDVNASTIGWNRRPLEDELLAALEACEENLRLIHEAAGPVPKSAPMPSHSTFGAWELARGAIAKARGAP